MSSGADESLSDAEYHRLTAAVLSRINPFDQFGVELGKRDFLIS